MDPPLDRNEVVRPRRVAFVIWSLERGGAERVLSTLANEFVRRGSEATVIQFAVRHEREYTLDPHVTRLLLPGRPWPRRPSAMTRSGPGEQSPSKPWWRRLVVDRLLGLTKDLTWTFRLASRLRTIRPDVVISFMEASNVRTLLATRFLPSAVVVAERTDPRHHWIEPKWRLLRRVTYRWADALVVQTTSVAEWARAFVPANRIHVVPNPAPSWDEPQRTREAVVLGMGRLGREKGFDLLIEAFAKVEGRHPGWRLDIAGRGELRAELVELSRELGIGDRVRLLGEVDEPERELRRASIFALSSRYEGFPNVLLEAMACGTPVVAVDCPSGPRDIVEDETTGLLVPMEDASALASALERLMASAELRDRLGGNAREAVRARFSLEAVLALWEGILDAVTGR